MTDEKKQESGDEFAVDSSWTLDGDANSGCFFGSDRESSILSEFGWNLQSESDRNGGADFFDQIEGSDLTGSFHNLPGNRSFSSQCSNQAVPMGSIDKSGDASTPNPSVSSSSTEEAPEKSTASDEKPPETSKKSGKKGQKRIRQPRFAFMTKSNVDHLEDGYRWRKYGQKAVKNSPFPRSYYRCTNSKCTVKKRVERSAEDPTIVITTYEGQHCHHTSSFSRGGVFVHHEAATFAGRLTASPQQFYFPGMQFPSGGSLGFRQSQEFPCELGHSQAAPKSTPPLPTDEGLLGDIVPGMSNRRGG